MFKKKPNVRLEHWSGGLACFACAHTVQIKPLSPLKSSDRRRTADQIIADFGIEVPVDPNADPEDKTSSTAGLTAVRRSLLPENAMSARFTTTAGPDLKQVSGTVYVGSHEGTGGDQRILWVKVGEQMYPTGKSAGSATSFPDSRVGRRVHSSLSRSHHVAYCACYSDYILQISKLQLYQFDGELKLTCDSIHSLA